MLAVEFARFYGLEFSARANIPDIVNAVCATAANTGVELVLVDEIHNLNLATRAGAEVSDQLKYFAEPRNAPTCSSHTAPNRTLSARPACSLRPTPKPSRSPRSSARCTGADSPPATPTDSTASPPEIGRRLDQPDYQPKVAKDPIAHWIDDDCWRPPSLPPTTYRTLPGFGNQTITKPNQHRLDRHHRRARWFARNRRGGRVILYHRHVGSVLARDWSRKMEQFVGTVQASAETRTFNDDDSQEPTLDTAVYVRPTAMKSDYLDGAVSPTAWPVRGRPPGR